MFDSIVFVFDCYRWFTDELGRKQKRVLKPYPPRDSGLTLETRRCEEADSNACLGEFVLILFFFLNLSEHDF